MYVYALKIQTLQARPQNFSMAGSWGGEEGRVGVLILRLCIIDV
jgi:hypothetical protein